MRTQNRGKHRLLSDFASSLGNQAPNLFRQRPAAKQKWISKLSKGSGENPSFLADSNHLRYLNPRQWAAVYYGRSRLAGQSGCQLQNKTRGIFIPVPLQKLLRSYMKETGIKAGPIFISKNGKTLDRSNIWRDMKALCARAHVSPQKVFPHNLRHLFARTFYSIEKDIVRLADLLGHSNVDTTRIYTVETGTQHISRLEQVQILLTT